MYLDDPIIKVDIIPNPYAQFWLELHQSIRFRNMVSQSEVSFCSRYNWTSGKQRRMACQISEYAKFEVCTVMRFLQAAVVYQIEIHRRLQSFYRSKVLSQKEFNLRCQNFKHGRKESEGWSGEEKRQSKDASSIFIYSDL